MVCTDQWDLRSPYRSALRGMAGDDEPSPMHLRDGNEHVDPGDGPLMIEDAA